MGNLQGLDLSNNKLTTLQTGTFDQMGNLHGLDLSNNKLTTLQTGTFDQMGNLQILVVSGNPLHCDCHLVALIRFMKTRRLELKLFSSSTEPSCQNPLNLKDTLLKDISLQEVVCDSGNATTQTYTVDVTSVNSMVKAGDNYTSLCNISGHGTLDIITNLKVKWYHNSKLLTSQCTLEDVSMAEKYSCEVLPLQQNSISSEMTVMDIQREDVGILICELTQQVKENGIWEDKLLEYESAVIQIRGICRGRQPCVKVTVYINIALTSINVR
ncbi:slit homolog 2 protein-like [Ostrea edulis]|uniref:slit homolog 2 protein-like n=1 Tax=Ostrea edulis TaxID=37623 RepID=UPI0024AF7FA7|nr:slit homolog 2 protein-like [Ostrea edulis]